MYKPIRVIHEVGEANLPYSIIFKDEETNKTEEAFFEEKFKKLILEFNGKYYDFFGREAALSFSDEEDAILPNNDFRIVEFLCGTLEDQVYFLYETSDKQYGVCFLGYESFNKYHNCWIRMDVNPRYAILKNTFRNRPFTTILSDDDNMLDLRAKMHLGRKTFNLIDKDLLKNSVIDRFCQEIFPCDPKFNKVSSPWLVRVGDTYSVIQGFNDEYVYLEFAVREENDRMEVLPYGRRFQEWLDSMPKIAEDGTFSLSYRSTEHRRRKPCELFLSPEILESKLTEIVEVMHEYRIERPYTVRSVAIPLYKVHP